MDRYKQQDALDLVNGKAAVRPKGSALRAAAERLVLLPGLHGTESLFQPFLDALPVDSDVSVVSYPHDLALGYEELQGYVLGAVPEGPYVLVAESFSGPLAIAHAASGPPNLQAIVLCATFIANPLPWALRWLRYLPLRLAFQRTPPGALVRAFLAGRDCPPQLLDAVIGASKAVKPLVMAHRLAQVFDVDVAGLLESVEVPVLYLAGSKDRLVGLRGLDQVSPHSPGLRSVVMDSPHLLLQRRPVEAVQEILRFLADEVPDS